MRPPDLVTISGGGKEIEGKSMNSCRRACSESDQVYGLNITGHEVDTSALDELNNILQDIPLSQKRESRLFRK